MRERTYEIKIEGVPIIVTKKRMKNMYLRISKEDGTVRISAPHQMSDARIVAFAGERIEWIRKYRQQGAGCGGNRAQKEAVEAGSGASCGKMGAGDGREGLRNHDPADEDEMGFLQRADASHQHQSGALVQAAGVSGIRRRT